LVLADDKKMRNALKQEGLVVTGCVGILIQAKKRELITNVKEPLDKLIEKGLRLSKDFYEEALKLSAE
jgi:predicted nucleic acid-binding protein